MTVRSAQTPQLRVVDATAIKRQRRKPRTPKHTWNVKAKPYEIHPVMLAPVLPGETMQSLVMQARVVTDPVKNPLIGWFQEYYFAYVSHRALHAWDTTGLLQQMMLDTSTDVSSLKAGANSDPYFTFKGGMNWVQPVLEACIDEWFRDEDETASSASIENYFAAQLDTQSWLQSFKLETAGTDDNELVGVDQLEDHMVLDGFTNEYAQWELMRDQGLTDLTYEDYLKTYGVNVPQAESSEPEERFKPELIRMFRKWSYPSNTIDPATGSPSSAVFWDIKERADKKRFFKEPGFLIGFCVNRPKLYMGNQKGAAAGVLDNAYKWLPAVLQDHAYVSVAETTFSATDGVLQNQAEDYWIDVKDLFLHGDEFRNHAVDHAISVPTAAGVTKYPTEAMINSLFVTLGSEYVRQDGVALLNILSRQSETTP